MNLNEIVQKLNLKILNRGSGIYQDVKGGYVGDLLSDVIASSKSGDIWVTIQVHENIVAVASLKNLAGIILAKNRSPLNETLENARNEDITLLQTELNSFQIVQKLKELGISGNR